jgi:pyruvate/2-oxoglutarate dehydrogenase complex dihydrolipoamide acyltransferase (E2) component
MQEIRFPKFGMSTVEVEVVEVHVALGERVDVGSPVVDVETDKLLTTVESEISGIVTEIRVEIGGEYEVGDVVCLVEGD